jgi:sterile alpha motif and leucine zipper-containing kinase AZK
MKNIKNFSERDLQAFRHEFIKELKLLTVLNHPHIVRCFGGCTEHPNLFIVTEYCDGGSLYDLLHKKNVKLSTQQQFTYALGIAEGMKYLHTPKPVIAHRDLKSLNILFSNGIIKIIDFGLSRTKGTIHSLFKTRVGTYNWMAPEVMIHNQGYTEKADVWSFGMVLYEMTTNKIPYDYCGDDILKLTQEICDCKKLPPVPESLSIDPSLAAIMSKCWQWNPIDRPSFSEITETLKHEINKYNK